MPQAGANETFASLIEAIGDGVPNAEQYQTMSGLVLDFPESRKLARMDPFSPDYKTCAMQLYLFLRGRPEQGYQASRDEAPASQLPENIWTGLIPWSFRDAKMVSEHLHAWGHILAHLKLPPGGSVLEYGPGSGQLLLMLSRMGYSTCGVDIDSVALEGIRAQSAQMNLAVETERAEFGSGFAGRRFDCILFYEAFHHAFDFETLLIRLHDRLNPGGRIVLCGEPVVQAPFAGIPYPWGPRLDALSVFCIRRFGWMELGFTHDYLTEIARVTGWSASFHPYPDCGRAAIYVLELAQAGAAQAGTLQAGAAQASGSWRRTAPLRAFKGLLIKARRVWRKLRR